MKGAGVCDCDLTHISEGQNTLKSEGFGDRDPIGGYDFADAGYAVGCFHWVFAVFVPDLWVMTSSVSPESGVCDLVLTHKSGVFVE